MSATPHSHMSATPHSHVSATPHSHVSATPHSHVSVTPHSHVSATPHSHVSATPHSHVSATPHSHVSALLPSPPALDWVLSQLKVCFNYCSNYGTIATYSPIGNTQGWFGPTADSGWNSVLCAAYNIIYWNILCTVLCLYQLSNWCFWYPTYPPPGYFIIQITLVQSKTEQSSVSTVAECCVKTYTFWGHNVLTTNKQILTYCIQFCKHLNGFWYPGCTNISWQVNVYNMFASNTSSIYLM